LNFGAESAPEPASDSLHEPSLESPPALHFTPEDEQGPWELRVDQVRYDPVDRDALATLLKTGIWVDAVELQAQTGHWVALGRHPIYPAVRRQLLDQTRQIVEQVATGEWRRRENGATRTSMLSPQDSSPHSGIAAAPARPPRAGRLSGFSILVALLAGLALGLVALAVALPLMQAERAETAAARLTASATNRPALATLPPSEPTDADWQMAIDKARRGVARARAPQTFARALIARDRAAMARKVALRAMIDGGVQPALKRVFNRAIAADPRLHPDVVTLGVDEPIDGIFALGGGRSISMRMTVGGENKYAFKPAQDEWGNGWRAELAAYLFCEIVPCQFLVPRNRAARISRARFETLYAFGRSDWQASYARRFSDLHWVEEAGPDGITRDYLYGTLEDWAPHFVNWPIEYTEVYKDWLDVRFHPANLNVSYAAAIKPFKTLGGGDFYQDLLSEQGDATVRDIARQLSSLLVFDYLTQNWDRFSTTEKYYGVNNQFAAGRFISLDNGAAFYDEPIAEVGPRFELTSRFSRSMVTAVRALAPSAVNDVLFPDPSWTERRRLELFWQQRDKMLRRVDALVERYGERRVFEFR
jgi:hypothetical protein